MFRELERQMKIGEIQREKVKRKRESVCVLRERERTNTDRET